MEVYANCILATTKTGEQKLVACVVLATTRLDVNKRVRKKISARKVSFATPEDTLRLTGLELEGVTPRHPAFRLAARLDRCRGHGA